MSRAKPVKDTKLEPIPTQYPDELSDSDKELWVLAFQEFAESQARLRQAETAVQQAQAMLNQAQQDFLQKQGAANFLLSRFRLKYGLDGHETISDVGVIAR